jgi:ABC-type polysaccharide/polyol phosphate export systems, permease component
MHILSFDRNDLRLGINFTRMMIRDRFLGSSLGSLWAILNPALLLTIFTFVFGFIFQSRLPGAETSISFVIWLISGYGPWLAISEGIMGSTSSVVSQSGLIKNLAFKTELLPLSATMLGIVPLLVSLVVLVVLLAVDGRAPNVAWLVMPVVLLMQTLFIGGLGLILATFNVFKRDIAQILPSLLTLLLFASPIFYPIDAYPEYLRAYVLLNPFYIIANGYREPILFGRVQPLWELVYLTCLAIGTFALGLMVFRRLKSEFYGQL